MNTVCSIPIAFACFVVLMMLSNYTHCEITTDSTVTMSGQSIIFEEFQFQYGVSD